MSTTLVTNSVTGHGSYRGPHVSSARRVRVTIPGAIEVQQSPIGGERQPSLKAETALTGVPRFASRPGLVCDHDWRWIGKGPAQTNCEAPNRLACVCCSRGLTTRCGSTRAAVCGPCAESHRRRLAQIFVSGTTGARHGQWFWCTITAPGEDVLPWDAGACTHAAEVPCSGSLGCQVDAFDAAVWNGNAPRRWSWFMTYLRRRIGENVQYFAVWEDQKRGVLHRHFMVRVDRPITEKRVKAAVRGAARMWGFGTQYDATAVTGDTAKQAWYCAKYATKTADSMDGRSRLDPATGELRPTRGFRPWSCSRQWGDTMAAVKARQASYVRRPAASAASLDDNSQSSTLDGVRGSALLPSTASPVLL